MRLLSLAALGAALSLSLSAPVAACSTSGTGALCVSVPSRPADLAPASLSGSSAASTLVSVGEVVPRGEYSIILNADYYGLPPVRDGWVYMRIGDDAWRVDWRSHEVLELVTDRTAANF